MSEQEIYIEVMNRRDPTDRCRFLDRACAGNEMLRQRVERLIRQSDQLGSFLENSPHAVVATADISFGVEQPGTLVGPYKLLEQIGEGGFGIVFMAQQQEPVRRKVALKVVKPGMDTRQVVARFEAERQALAMMDHPNIAKIFDGGEAASGRPFFVMELVTGVPITDFCEHNQLSVQSRLELFINVCQAVQHAHQKGVIHRDLKPSNIMVTLHDGTPVVKVIDFGIAKAMGEQLTEKTLFTNFAHLMGTPIYMSPEQAEMSGLDIDTRADIYSLGVLLYELLTGTTPFDKERLKSASFDEMRRIIREEEPETVSARLAKTRTTKRGVDDGVNRRAHAALPELDWIVTKALEKERNRRYESAGDLALDVQRFLHDEPVHACPPSTWYSFQKFSRRNKVALATASVIFAVLILGTLISSWQAVRARRAERQTRLSFVAERQARQDAEANLLKARQVVDQYLTLTSESRLLDVPGLQPLRKELLEAALGYYQDFLQQRPNDPRLLADVAAGYLRVGHIYTAIDANREAVAALEQGLKLVEQLDRDFPRDQQWQARLAETYKVGRDLHHGSEGPAEAAKALTLSQKAIELWQRMAAGNPGTPGFRSDLAGLHSFRADLELVAGRRDRALAAHQQARDLWEALARQNPAVADYRAELSCSLDGMGKILERLRQPHEAENAYSQSLELRRRLAEEFPDRTDYCYEVALAELRLVRLLPVEQAGEAEIKLRQIQGLLAKLVAEFPSVPSFRENLGISHHDLSYAFWRLGRLDEAIGESRQSLAICERLAADFPALPQYRDRLANRSRDLAMLLSAAGRHEEAERWYAQAVEVMEQLLAAAPQDIYRRRLGAIYEDHGDLRLSLGRRDDGAADYRRAIELLQIVVTNAPDVPLYVRELAALLATCPIVELRDVSRAIELADRATRIAPEESASWYTLGFVQYRAGNWPAAQQALKKWVEQRAGSDSREWFLLAMTCWRMSQAPDLVDEQRLRYQAEARAWYARGVDWQEKHKPLNEDLRRMRSEAAALLKIDPADS